MDIQTVTNLLISLISIAGLWILFHWPYRTYRVDLLRDRLFTARDELFAVASDGAVEFDHPAYCMLRSTTNGFLHQSRVIGLSSTLLSLRRVSQLPKEALGKSWNEVAADLDPDTRVRLGDIRDRMNWAILDHFVFTSVMVFSTVIPVVLWFVLHKFGQGLVVQLKSAMGGFVDQIDIAAMAAGGTSAPG